MRYASLAVTTLILGSLAFAQNASKPRPIDPTPSSSAVPITRLALYKNGVGYFEHAAQVTGDQSVTIDLNGVRISGAGYNSTTPLDQQLKTLALRLDANPFDIDFYTAIRSSRAQVTGPGVNIAGHLPSLDLRSPFLSARGAAVGPSSPSDDTRRSLSVVSEVDVDPADTGRVFEGIGAVSAGASSRLLIDYPEPQRSQILDLLFKPHYGAGFQHLKVEIGGDVNSTDGTEPSFAHTRTDENDNRGYEWWLMEEALKRNPQIILDCLAWGAPGWIGTGRAEAKDFFSQDMANYLVRFLTVGRTVHHLPIRYIGIWNERPYDAGWIKLLRETLDRNGLQDVKIAAADQINRWGLIDEMEKDGALRDSVASVAVHYPSYKSTPAAIRSGLPLWSSEDGPWKGDWDGAQRLARIFNRNYVQGRMTKTEIWSPITSYYDILPLPGSGVMRANTPWSGAFDIQPALWATAMTTQFIEPGWRYLDSASKLIEGGSVVTLLSPTNGDITLVAETTEAKRPQQLDVHLAATLPIAALHAWRTTAIEQMTQLPDIAIHNQAFSLALEPDAIYTFSSTTGQRKGNPVSPRPKGFPLPFRLAPAGLHAGRLPAFCSDQAGSFETVKEDGEVIVRQMVAQRGIEWDKNPSPETIFGDSKWTDYELSLKARIPISKDAGPDSSISLYGRVKQIRQDDTPPIGYSWKLEGSGHWQLSVEVLKAGEPDKQGKSRQVPMRIVLSEGMTVIDLKQWRRFAMRFAGDRIVLSIDGKQLGEVHDTTTTAGMTGFGSGWHIAEFRDITVTK